jgi:hypothetical protein
VEQILEQPDERGRGFVVSLGIKASDHEDQLDPVGCQNPVRVTRNHDLQAKRESRCGVPNSVHIPKNQGFAAVTEF